MGEEEECKVCYLCVWNATDENPCWPPLPDCVARAARRRACWWPDLGDDGFDRMGLCVRFLIHRLATGGRRFFGEYQGPIEEGEFTDVAQVVSDSGARGKVRHGAQHRPERVAGSVCSLLTHSGRQKGTNR